MSFLYSAWFTLCELSPWLLLGMFLSGLLHVVLPAKFVRTSLRGFSGVLKSVAIGVPLPLCSCGVIPAGIGLKKDGASTGAAVGFLISTPQTGVDSMLVSASFFGWPFAIFKLAAAAVMGIVGGVWSDRKIEKKPDDQAKPANINQLPIVDTADSQGSHANVSKRGWDQLLPHAIDMLRSIWVWLVIGVLVSALIAQFDIQPLTAKINQWGLFPAMLLVLLFSIPLYVCATASVPIAAALVSSGFPPAVALVFLMAGPATNVATIGAIRSNLGNRALLIYLSTIVVGSMIAALLFDGLISATAMAGGVAHVHNTTAWWAQLSAAIVTGLMLWFVSEKVNRRLRMARAANTSDAISNQQSVQTIGVGGMSCGNCVQKLESALGKLDGVTSAQASLSAEEVSVIGDADPQLLKQTIIDCGFSPQ